MARVGFLGTGEIAAQMVHGLEGQGHAITVSDRNASVARSLAEDHAEVTIASNAEVVRESDIVILCLMAPVARTVLADLPWRADLAVISVMVDVPLSDLARLCAPATDIALTIPLPFIATGGCPLPVYPASPALQALFGDRNPVLPVPSEMALNAHFAATAMCAPMIAMVKSGSDWLAEVTGDKAGAEAYVAALIGGFISALAAEEDDRFDRALQSLATEGGLNSTLRRHMDVAGAPKALQDGMDGLRGRLGLPDRG